MSRINHSLDDEIKVFHDEVRIEEIPLNPLEMDLGNADSDEDFLQRNPWITKNSDFIN